MSIYSENGKIFDSLRDPFEGVSIMEGYTSSIDLLKMITESYENEMSIFESIINSEYKDIYLKRKIFSESNLDNVEDYQVMLRENGNERITKLKEIIKNLWERFVDKVMGILMSVVAEFTKVTSRVNKYKKFYKLFENGDYSDMKNTTVTITNFGSSNSFVHLTAKDIKSGYDENKSAKEIVKEIVDKHEKENAPTITLDLKNGTDIKVIESIIDGNGSIKHIKNDANELKNASKLSIQIMNNLKESEGADEKYANFNIQCEQEYQRYIATYLNKKIRSIKSEYIACVKLFIRALKYLVKTKKLNTNDDISDEFVDDLNNTDVIDVDYKEIDESFEFECTNLIDSLELI